MTWKKNEERNNKIKQLRSKGISIPSIAKSIGCSKSTVSYHCKSVNLTEEQKSKLKSQASNPSKALLATKANKTKWDERKNRVREQAKMEWDKIRSDPDSMAFLGLYWGEGRKNSKVIGISNNDPSIISFSHSYLKNLTNSAFGARIIFYPMHNPQKCKNFWSDLLPETKVRVFPCTDTRIKKAYWSNKCKWGKCDLYVSDWAIFLKIMTWIECWRAGIGSSHLCAPARI